MNPFPVEEPSVPPTGLMAFMAHFARPALPWLGLISVLTALIAVVELTFLSGLGSLVDWLSEANREVFLAEHGWTLAGLAALVVLVYPVLVLVQSLFMHQTVFGNFPMLVRWLSHRLLLHQSMSFFHDEFAGRVSQKVMQTAIAVRETVMKLIDVFVYIAVYFIGAMFLVGSADPMLTAPLLLWLAAYTGILVYFVPRLRRISMEQANARAEMTGRVVDSYTNIQTVKLFAHTRGEQTYARDAMNGFMGTVHRQMRLVTGLTFCLQTSNALLLAGIAALAIRGWLQAAVSLGAIAVAITLVLRIRSMADWILWEIASLFEHIGTVQDGINTITQPVSVQDGADATDLTVERGEIVIDGVRFGYDPAHPVFEDLDVTIRPGEKVGLVGPSGAGKSTLTSLLLRFHDAQAGRILVDGQDISSVTQESLRHQIGIVTQDTALLHRSIRDNIRYGRPEATDGEVLAAARKAQAEDFVSDLTDPKGRRGLDAHVGERGVKLSGGQRQRIAIARVLLKNAPILVLDEATSALDSGVEAAIQEQLDALMEGKTVIAIAHRLSTIAAMDRLIVLDQGRIAQTGTHEQLLRHGGLYADLWRRQSGGFLGDGDSPEGATRPSRDRAVAQA
ncbi:MAG: ABC transporter ATP-binding protein [Halofilum sp. (in: g-proteobacteria)]